MSISSLRQNSRTFSLASARFVVITMFSDFPALAARSLARGTTCSINSKFRSGSPPWNSSVYPSAGLLNITSRARSAVLRLISYLCRSGVWRDTWQYKHECSHRRVVTKMCSFVKPSRKLRFVRYFVARTSRSGEDSSSKTKCRDRSCRYSSEEVSSRRWTRSKAVPAGVSRYSPASLTKTSRSELR